MSVRPHPAARVSIVVPLHDEEATLRELVAQLQSLPLGDPWELVLVDDGSTDGTWNVVRELAGREPRIRAVRLSRNFGKEAAVRAGLEHARGAAAIIMDADLQHPVSLVPQMVRAWSDRGAMIVEARKRRDAHAGVLDRALSSAFYAVFRRASGADLRGASDFQLLDRRVVDLLLSFPERSMFFRGLSTWVGFHRREQLVFDVAPRAGGRSSWSFTRRARLAADAISAFSAWPLRLITLSGLVFLGFGLLLAVETLYMKFSGRAVDGFTTVILLVIIVGGLIMMALGIIGEYLSRIYDEVKGRPRHVVEEVLPPAGGGGD